MVSRNSCNFHFAGTASSLTGKFVTLERKYNQLGSLKEKSLILARSRLSFYFTLTKIDRNTLIVDVASNVSCSASTAADALTPDSDVSVATCSRTTSVAVGIVLGESALLRSYLVVARIDRLTLVCVLIPNEASFADAAWSYRAGRSFVEVFVEARVVTLRNIVRENFINGTTLLAKTRLGDRVVE